MLTIEGVPLFSGKGGFMKVDFYGIVSEVAATRYFEAGFFRFPHKMRGNVWVVMAKGVFSHTKQYIPSVPVLRPDFALCGFFYHGQRLLAFLWDPEDEQGYVHHIRAAGSVYGSPQLERSLKFAILTRVCLRRAQMLNSNATVENLPAIEIVS